MTRVLTANEVYLQLLQLGRDLDANVTALESADEEATRKRHDADVEEAKAYLVAEGSVEQRKRAAFLACERLISEAAVAETVVRHLKRRGHAISERIDIGRSYASAIKAEVNLGQAGATP